MAALLSLGASAFMPPASAQRIIINQLNDVNLGQWPGSGDMQGVEPHCVGRDTPNFSTAQQFRLRARGSGPGNRFVISSGANTIDYIVEYRDNVNSTAWTELRANANNQRFFAPHWIFCFFGFNTQELRITVREADLIGKPSGSYTGRLTIVVSPI